MKTILIASMLLTALPAVAAGKFAGELLVGDSDQAFDVSAHSVSDEGESTAAGGFSLGDHTHSYGIRGSYQPFKYLAVELGYQQYGKFAAGADYSHLTFDADSINVGVKGVLPLSAAYSLNARVGLADWDMYTSSNDPNPNNDINRIGGQGKDTYYALGADYQINDNLFVGLNYSVVTMKWRWSDDMPSSIFVVDSEHEIKNITLSLGVRF